MPDVAHVFLNKSRHLLLAEYRPVLRQCLDHLEDADIWWRPNDSTNSIGNLILHLNGSLRQWIIGGVAGRQIERDRQREFAERGPISRDDLWAGLEATLREVDEVLGGLDAVSLVSRRQILSYDVTVLEAIYHVVDHFGHHAGQIITLTKLRTEKELGIWSQRTIAASR
jgi:uncharacterized damage-inducible protein DinB